MRTQIHVSLLTETLFGLDSWRERHGGLSRGDAIAALLRLAAGGGEAARPLEAADMVGGGPGKAIADAWNNGGPVNHGRVVEPVDRWEP